MMMEQAQTVTPILATPLEGYRILMPLGIIGFPDLQHYMLNPILSEGLHTSFWRFESQDHKDISFVLLESAALAERITIEPNKIYLALDAVNADRDNIEVFYIVTIEKTNEGKKKVTVNVRAPVIINANTSQSWQIILQGSDYPIDYVL